MNTDNSDLQTYESIPSHCPATPQRVLATACHPAWSPRATPSNLDPALPSFNLVGLICCDASPPRGPRPHRSALPPSPWLSATAEYNFYWSSIKLIFIKLININHCVISLVISMNF